MSSHPDWEPPSPHERLIEFSTTLHVLTPRVFVTQLLIAANAIVFALMVFREPQSLFTPSGPTLIDFGANFGPRTLDKEPWRLFTSMFVHIGVLHIAMNMWALWNVGRLMERVLGNLGFLLLYVVSGLCGSLASVAFNPSVLSAGASGAIFGVIGSMLGFLVLGRGSMPAEVVTDVRSSATSMIVYCLAFGFVARGIDNAAHIGGLLGGCLCGLVLGQELTLARPVYRWPRNLLVLLLGTGIVAGGVRLLPPSIAAVLQAAGQTEERVIDHFNELAMETNAGKLSEFQFADAIENEILPPWRAATTSLENISRSPKHLRPLLDAYAQYFRRRQELWELRLNMLRHPEQDQNEELARRETAVEAAMAELTRVSQESKRLEESGK